MKKFRHYALLLVTAMAVFGCSKDYDDTAIKNDISDLQSRVEKLETWCTTVNGQISALQGLVTALEAKDYVTGVSPVTNGYTINFSKSESITIYNGKDGAKGTDGVTPVIGVDKFEGEYYWTVKTGTAAATWILDADGKKIRTTGDKGADGSAGINGQSPVLSVATDTDGKVYWKVNGEWLLNSGKKVQATGDKGDKGETGSAGAAGADGAQGDAVFAADGVTVDKTKGTVTFTLAGEDGATFTLPMASEMKIFDKFDEFKVNSEKHELTLALNVKDGDYAAIKAELTSSKGMEVAMVKATTRAASTPWGVELTSPTFKEDKTIDANAKVNFILPAGMEEGESALLKVTVVGKDGTEHSATRVIVYTTEVSVESVALADKSVVEGGTIKLEPIFTPATATNKNVTWKSSNPEVAAIAADGTVTGVAKGETTITVTTADGSFTATCKVTVAEKPKDYIEVNGIKVAVGNLVADGMYGAKIGTPTNGGLFFQFGSLIGWSSTGNPTIAVQPDNFNGNRGWTNTNKIWESTATVPFTIAGSGSTYEKAGVGDPCRYYLKGTWRLPTGAEYKTLFKDNGYPSTGPWTWNATSKSAEHKDGLKFPTLGYRGLDGKLNSVGSLGHYWSSSSESQGFGLLFNNSLVLPSGGTDQVCGFTVRCVRD